VTLATLNANQRAPATSSRFHFPAQPRTVQGGVRGQRGIRHRVLPEHGGFRAAFEHSRRISSTGRLHSFHPAMKRAKLVRPRNRVAPSERTSYLALLSPIVGRAGTVRGVRQQELADSSIGSASSFASPGPGSLSKSAVRPVRRPAA